VRLLLLPAFGSSVVLLLLLLLLSGGLLVASAVLLGAVVGGGWASCSSCAVLELLLLLLCSSRAASSACLTGPARVTVGVCCGWPEFTAQLLLLLLPAVGSSALLLAMFGLALSLEALLLEVRLQRTLDE
jgi:hypothetical protein